MVLVYVVHEGGRWSPYDAHYLPGPETPVTRLSEPANYRVSADDPPDRTVLCAEMPVRGRRPDLVGHRGRARRRWSTTRCAPPGCRRCAGPASSCAGCRTSTRSTSRATTTHLAPLDSWVEALARVTTFGRLGLFAHDNTHHAMAMAYDAVDALGVRTARGTSRRGRPRGDRFADHVVED